MAGADPDRLRTTPEDVKVYTLLGSTVFISSGMAVVGMFVTLDFAFAYGEHASFGRIVLIGLLALAYGAIILAIDRMLVSLPLRSIDFVPGKNGGPTTVRNGSLVRMVFALLPRFLLALTIGVLVAEPLLLLAFRSEVDARVGRIATAASREAQAADAVRYQDLIDEASVKTPEQQQLETLTGQRTANLAQIGTLTAQAESEESLARAEAAGTNGDTFGQDLSGLQGCGPRCQGHQYKAQQARAQIKTLETDNTQLTTQIDQLTKQVGTAETDRVTAYNKALEDLKSAQTESGKLNAYSTGILIRIQALEQLARSDYPFGGDPANRPTVRTTPSPGASTPGSATTPSSGGAASAGGAATSGGTATSGGSATSGAATTPSTTSTPPPVVPTVTSVDSAVESDSLKAHTWMGLTPLAMAINITRLFLIALDCMPILGKALVSLRKRRPYETAVARAEHNRVLEQLVAVDAAEAESDLLRASMRESRRAAFDSAGGAWVAGPWGDSFVGPDGSLTLPDGARAGIHGLSVEHNGDGTWSVGSRDDGARPRPPVRRGSQSPATAGPAPAPRNPVSSRDGSTSAPERRTARPVTRSQPPDSRSERSAGRAETPARPSRREPFDATTTDPFAADPFAPAPPDPLAPTVPVGPADPTRELPSR